MTKPTLFQKMNLFLVHKKASKELRNYFDGISFRKSIDVCEYYNRLLKSEQKESLSESLELFIFTRELTEYCKSLYHSKKIINSEQYKKVIKLLDKQSNK